LLNDNVSGLALQIVTNLNRLRIFMTKIALITGATGQDGAYLARLLLDKGYFVYGTFRRTSSANFWRLQEVGALGHERFRLAEFDLTDMGSALRLIERIKPSEVYNLAAQSFVGVSFDQPVSTGQISGMGVVHLLEAIRTLDRSIRFYQASTSEMFGKVQSVPQTEATPFYPRSPYGAAKMYAHWMTVNYRESYDMFASSGILFNHESPLRGREFVTRKITEGVAKIKMGIGDVLELGNLDAERDWGYALDYVDGMHRILQHSEPDTFVLATGKRTTVRNFVTMAFACAGVDVIWRGVGEAEVGLSAKDGKTLVKVNPDFYRPAEVDLLIGDASKAKESLGWQPMTSLEELCAMMVEADLKRARQGYSF
jgi:GDPmannose 4,6-dehydratase